MYNEACKVFVQSDEQGYITAVNSSAFVDGEGWTEIDSGHGDKYHHAQANYFPLPLMTDNGAYQYKLIDGKVVECSAEEIADQEAAHQPEAEEPASDYVTWAELSAALSEGVNSI